MGKRMKSWIFSLSMILCTSIFAQKVNIQIFKVSKHQLIGYILATDSPQGLILKPQLAQLTPGKHGFHIHKNPSCKQQGQAAGGHFDPAMTHHHLGPYKKNGHLGDLPILMVNDDGRATIPVIAPHLRVKDIIGHSIMIHAGGDTYQDTPPLGGGGARVACGVIHRAK